MSVPTLVAPDGGPLTTNSKQVVAGIIQFSKERGLMGEELVRIGPARPTHCRFSPQFIARANPRYNNTYITMTDDFGTVVTYRIVGFASGPGDFVGELVTDDEIPTLAEDQTGDEA